MSSGANVEIRPARQNEMLEINRITGYAFANNDLPKDPPEPPPLAPEHTLCAFDGERMVASSGAFPFKMRCNGRTVAADGVTLVSCDPGYRRRGIVRRLMDGLLQRAHEREVPLAILWASMGAIYQRFGYGLTTTSVAYEIPPRFIQFQFGERPAGGVRLLEKDEALPLVKAIYRQYAEGANGLLHRGDFYWDIMLRRQNDQHTYIAVYYDADDAPRGYSFFRTLHQPELMPETSQVMDVFDFIWLDMAAYRGLWEFFAGHDLVERIRFDMVAEDDPAPNLLLEPRRLRRKTWDGIWTRVVDAEAALGARGYDIDGEVVLEVVDDDLCPWNNGCFRLTATTEGATVERLTGSTAPDLATRPDALATLLAGQARASELARMGRLTIPDVDRAAALDGLFATKRRPHCPNMF